MKITLINPPFLYISDHKLGVSQCIGLRSISSYLKSLGHEVVFIDALMLGFDNVKPYANGYIVGLEYPDLVARIPADTDFVGLSVPFSQVGPIAHDLIDLIRGRLPDVRIVMGGVYPSTQPELALKSSADYVVVGDGENAFAQILDAAPGERIAGVYTPADRGRTSFPSAKWVGDLNSMPLPDFDIPHIDDYFNVSPRARTGTRTAALVTSRGCPYECTFCSVHPTAGFKFRRQSTDYVIDQIEILNRKYGVTSLEIEDDNFTLKPKRAMEILEGIIRMNEKGANLSWRTPNGVRIDTLSDQAMALIKRSRCTELTLALEHGDQEMVSTFMKKRLDLDVAYDVMSLAAKHQVNTNIFIIVGYPGETRDKFDNCVRYLRKVKALGGHVTTLAFIAQPYPGTELLAECRARGYLRPPPGITYENFDNFLERRDLMSTGSVVSIETPDFDREEVLARQAEIKALFPPPLKMKKVASLIAAA